LAVGSLRAQPAFKDLTDDVEVPFKEAASDVTAWTLTHDSLTITFGQYAIGPYSDGMPEAHIPWGDLKSYLAPDFQPTTLPLQYPNLTPDSRPAGENSSRFAVCDLDAGQLSFETSTKDKLGVDNKLSLLVDESVLAGLVVPDSHRSQPFTEFVS
jgi:hypothetical protein